MRSGPLQNAEKACKRKNCPGKTGNRGHFACFGAFAKPCGNVKFSCKAAKFATWRSFLGAFAKPRGNAKFSCKATNFATWRNFLGAFAEPCGDVKFSCKAANFTTWRSFLGAFAKPAGMSNSVAASVARTACVHARFIWKFFLLLQMSLSPWRPVGVVNILKRPGPLCRRAAAIAEGRADFRRKAFHRGGAERSHPKAAVVKSAFEPSLVCRFAGNAALLPGLTASKRRILQGILQTLPATAFQAQARIYGRRLQKREIPAGY